MADTLTTGSPDPFARRGSEFARRGSEFLTPPRSPRRPPISPRPSSSMLKLQKLGLELGPSQSSLSLHAPSYNSSIRTTPSDLDKPLPLEPPEIERRASSVYSVETTISNILELYGGSTDHVGRESSIPNAHRSQAYRDTVAPLIARQYNGAESPPPLPLLFMELNNADSPPPLLGVPTDDDVVFPLPPPMPSPSIYQDESPPMSPDVLEIRHLPESAWVPSSSRLSPSIYQDESPPMSPDVLDIPDLPDPTWVPPPRPSPSIYQDASPPMSPDVMEVPDLPESAWVPSPNIFSESPLLSPEDSKYDVPSFIDPAHNPPEKRPEVISPLSSAGSEDYHRQLAMDSLAPPSPKASPDVRPVAFEGSDIYLPGPMSGTITHVVAAPDMVPPPLDLNRASHYASPQQTETKDFDNGSRNSFENFLRQSAQQDSPAESLPDIYNHSPAQTPEASLEKLEPQRFTAEEQHRILSYASEKYPGITSPSEISPIRTSKGSSLSQRASSLIHAISPISPRKSSADKGFPRKSTEMGPDTAEYVPGGRKKLAIQPTSYQLYGEAAWYKEKDKYKKKRKKEQRSSKGSTRSTDLGEEEKMGFLKGARHKLTRTASEKRREQLKNSIKLVGPTEITKQRHAREDPRKWWE